MEFMTQDERNALEERLKDLIARRAELVERIADARTKGDLRENSEYHAAREDLAMNQRATQEIEEKLKRAMVTDASVVPDGMVFIGATVKLLDLETSEEELYRLVGEAKVDFSADYIEVSANSPMGQSLMKARVGETIRVDLPRGRKEYRIVDLL